MDHRLTIELIRNTCTLFFHPQTEKKGRNNQALLTGFGLESCERSVVSAMLGTGRLNARLSARVRVIRGGGERTGRGRHNQEEVLLRETLLRSSSPLVLAPPNGALCWLSKPCAGLTGNFIDMARVCWCLRREAGTKNELLTVPSLSLPYDGDFRRVLGYQSRLRSNAPVSIVRHNLLSALRGSRLRFDTCQPMVKLCSLTLTSFFLSLYIYTYTVF